MKFKKGDRVIIKDGRGISNYTGGWNTSMAAHVGKVYTIKSNGKHWSGGIAYKMEEESRFIWDERALEKASNECIVIYRKGSETIALDKTTGKKAVAKLSPEDEYDFMTGAKLAFERLTEPKVREVKRKAKVGEYVKVTNDDGHIRFVGDIFKVTRVDKNGWIRGSEEIGDLVRYDEYVVLEGYQPPEEKEPEFKPYLELWGKFHGYIGEPTPLKDAIGRELEVGDTVELYNSRNNYQGECIVCNHVGEDKAFVRGIACDCKPDGTIKGGWKIIFKRKHKGVAHGEVVDDIKYVKERATEKKI